MIRNPPQTTHSLSERRWFRAAILLFVYGAIFAVAHWGSEWLINVAGVDLSPAPQSHARRVLIAGLTLYTVLMAVPFMPGMEISLALLAAFGKQVALLLYAATIAALATSFLIGRLVPMRMIASLFRFVGLQRAESLVTQLEPLSAQQRLETLMALAPPRIVPLLLKRRYIAVAVALNVPGNAIIGGGGGIALLAGISGLFSFPYYLAAVSLAVLPVPLTIMLFG